MKGRLNKIGERPYFHNDNDIFSPQSFISFEEQIIRDWERVCPQISPAKMPVENQYAQSLLLEFYIVLNFMLANQSTKQSISQSDSQLPPSISPSVRPSVRPSVDQHKKSL